MSKLVIMLSPPRSFSSVVSTMIGEHPDLYGFPELHVFLGDTVQDVIDYERRKGGRNKAGPPGLLRTLAQIHDGVQTNGAAFRAIGWLHDRREWSTKKLMDYLLEAVSPKIGLEKSPITSQKAVFLDRVYSYYPDAYYLHLTRHPISTRSSWEEFVENRAKLRKGAGQRERMDRLIGWHHMHANILRFTSTLPLGQTLRVKGEDILSEPDVYLPQIAEWLGIRTDRDAIEAMKHPENSPYARLGPDVARGGNDPKFMRSPELRARRVKEPSLEAFFKTERMHWFPPEGTLSKAARRCGLKIAPDEKIAGEIAEVANLLGYL
jgi:Sulfotransferase family